MTRIAFVTLVAPLLLAADAGTRAPRSRAAKTACDVSKATAERPCRIKQWLGLEAIERAEADFADRRAVMPEVKAAFVSICTAWQKQSSDLRRQARERGLPPKGLTPTSIYPVVGPADAELWADRFDRPFTPSRPMKPVARAWRWTSCGALRGCVILEIPFFWIDDNWSLGLCRWCDPAGCATFPVDG